MKILQFANIIIKFSLKYPLNISRWLAGMLVCDVGFVIYNRSAKISFKLCSFPGSTCITVLPILCPFTFGLFTFTFFLIRKKFLQLLQCNVPVRAGFQTVASVSSSRFSFTLPRFYKSGFDSL